MGQILLKTLKELRQLVPNVPDPSSGICYNVDEMTGGEGLFRETLQEMAKKWPATADPYGWYPVEGSWEEYRRHDKWQNPRRIELLNWMIEELEMSMQKAYDLVCNYLEREYPICSRKEAADVAVCLHTVKPTSVTAYRQVESIKPYVGTIYTWPQKAQEVELQVIALRLHAALKAEAEAQSHKACDKCGRPIMNGEVTVAIGTETYTCCKTCSDRLMK